MTTSSDTPDTPQQTPRPKPKLGMIALGLLLILAVAAAAFVFGYALKGTEPVEAAAAKTDFATTFSAPKCADDEVSITLRPNVATWSADIQATATFESSTGLAGDILISSEARDGLPAVKMTKVYAWEPSSNAGGKPGWLVTRYIVPEPTTALLIKGSNLSAAGRLAVCGLK